MASFITFACAALGVACLYICFNGFRITCALIVHKRRTPEMIIGAVGVIIIALVMAYAFFWLAYAAAT
jgi:hypothetical protein